jgi:hypothetical protein
MWVVENACVRTNKRRVCDVFDERASGCARM